MLFQTAAWSLVVWRGVGRRLWVVASAPLLVRFGWPANAILRATQRAASLKRVALRNATLVECQAVMSCRPEAAASSGRPTAAVVPTQTRHAATAGAAVVSERGTGLRGRRRLGSSGSSRRREAACGRARAWRPRWPLARKPIVADAMEAVRQGVQQEAADELVGVKRHDLGLAVMAIVLPAEADLRRQSG